MTCGGLPRPLASTLWPQARSRRWADQRSRRPSAERARPGWRRQRPSGEREPGPARVTQPMTFWWWDRKPGAAGPGPDVL